MAATISGFLEIVEKLMRLGADLYLKSCNEMTVLGKNFSMNFFYINFFIVIFSVLEWAKRFTKNEIVDLIECYL